MIPATSISRHQFACGFLRTQLNRLDLDMGYQETLCQLCGIGFAIARIRHAGEPKQAAWDWAEKISQTNPVEKALDAR